MIITIFPPPASQSSVVTRSCSPNYCVEQCVFFCFFLNLNSHYIIQSFNEWTLRSPKRNSQRFVIVTSLPVDAKKRPNASTASLSFYDSMIRRHLKRLVQRVVFIKPFLVVVSVVVCKDSGFKSLRQT
jgi:hypothetical protein